jgi:hypothetical protein
MKIEPLSLPLGYDFSKLKAGGKFMAMLSAPKRARGNLVTPFLDRRLDHKSQNPELLIVELIIPHG